MKIPDDAQRKEAFLRLIIDACTASQLERRTLYEKRRRYFLYGQDADQKARFNRLKSHIKLVSSFLFSPDGLVYNITPPKNADDLAIQQLLALQDDFNEDIYDSGVADVFGEAVTWAINFDTMILKAGWNDTTRQPFVELIEPSSFGVFREDRTDFSSQPAMNHSFLLDYDEARLRLTRAGRADKIADLRIDGEAPETGLPQTLTNLIISATGGADITGNIMGQVNPDYEAAPRFQARLTAPMVRFHETWIWDDELDDYRIFHSLEGAVILSDSKETIDAMKKAQKGVPADYDSASNWFIKKENPFIPITPYGLYNFFWGDCHLEDLIPLQNWSSVRLEQIDEILKRQEDPAKVLSGFMGISDEKAEALGGPGTWVSDSTPGAKVDTLAPSMPEDLFREFNEIGSLFMEQSGLTEVVSGRSSGGARGGQQQKQMQITGGGQIRKVAVRLESPLVRMGDLILKLKRKNDPTKIKLPDNSEFVAAQAPEECAVHVEGHSHSPLFTTETKELAATMFKAQAIDREWFIRLLNPPEKTNLLHALRAREKAEAASRAAHPEPPPKKGKH